MRRKPRPNRAGCAGLWVVVPTVLVLVALGAPLGAILVVCLLLFILAFFCAL